jgi:hypothetical protein
MMPHMMANLKFEDKLQIMGNMMPKMMNDFTFEQRIQMMKKMMPMMMKDIDSNQMKEMMNHMMPMMMNIMEEKEIEVLHMMELMCPKCISIASTKISAVDKQKLKKQMSEIFEKI